MSRPSVVAVSATILSALAVGACSSLVGPAMVNDASAGRTVLLIAGDGSARGSVRVREASGGTALTISVAGLPAGAHGVHLHEKGQCQGPAFTSAGGHWNPQVRKHGRDNPAGAHLGDLPNLDVQATGTGTADLTVAGGSTLADADGTSLVIHAKADDYRTDPSGNSGDRIACAVIAAPR
jgi:Cu-Zn family superoxide dismutase